MTSADATHSRRVRWAPLRRVWISDSAREKLLYTAAAVSYVSIGVFVTEFVLSWVIAFAWLLLWVWWLPALARRLRG